MEEPYLERVYGEEYRRYMAGYASVLWAARAVVPALIGALARAGGVAADAGHHDRDLHFSHPLIAESPSPDTKLRLDYFFLNESGEDKGERQIVRLEGEYAFARWISLEADVPWEFVDPDDGSAEDNLGTVEVGLKYANFAFEERGLLLGGGIELGLPTGDDSEDIGSNNILQVEPFLDFGFEHERFEAIGIVSFGVPTNEDGEDEADWELGWNLSFRYLLHPRLEAFLEFDGEEVFGGEEDGESIVNLTPSLKIAPWRDRSLRIGAGASLPLTSDQAFHVRAIVSVFYHF